MQSDQTMERYLSILGVEAGPPGFDHLSRLVQAQIMRVPFYDPMPRDFDREAIADIPLQADIYS